MMYEMSYIDVIFSSIHVLLKMGDIYSETLLILQADFFLKAWWCKLKSGAESTTCSCSEEEHDLLVSIGCCQWSGLYNEYYKYPQRHSIFLQWYFIISPVWNLAVVWAEWWKLLLNIIYTNVWHMHISWIVIKLVSSPSMFLKTMLESLCVAFRSLQQNKDILVHLLPYFENYDKRKENILI